MNSLAFNSDRQSGKNVYLQFVFCNKQTKNHRYWIQNRFPKIASPLHWLAEKYVTFYSTLRGYNRICKYAVWYCRKWLLLLLGRWKSVKSVRITWINFTSLKTQNKIFYLNSSVFFCSLVNTVQTTLKQQNKNHYKLLPLLLNLFNENYFYLVYVYVRRRFILLWVFLNKVFVWFIFFCELKLRPMWKCSTHHTRYLHFEFRSATIVCLCVQLMN